MSDNQYIKKGLRLKKIREILSDGDKSLVKFSEDMGIQYSNYSRIENGYRDIPTSLLEKLANVSKGNMKVNINYLLIGDGDPMIEKENNNLSVEKIPNVRFLNIAAFAGHAITAGEYQVEKWIYIPGLENTHDYYGILVDGNSMIPTLSDGDFIICYPLMNLAQEFKHGEVYVVVLQDKILVKRLFIKDGKIQLISDNPFFQPEIVSQDEILKLFAIKIRATPFLVHT